MGDAIVECACPSGHVGVCVDQIAERDLDRTGSGFEEGGELSPRASFGEGGPI